CSNGTCHGSGGRSAASLVLDTTEGIANTAINRVAQGSNTGAVAGRPSSPGKTFGVDMPIIGVNDGASGNPGNSLLVYHLQPAPAPPSDFGKRPPVICGSAGTTPAAEKPYSALAGGARLEPDEVEHAALSNAILGNQMPYPVLEPSSYFDQPLT